VIKQVQCECGFYARGTEADLVPAVQAHAKAKHGMDITAEQAIEQMWPYDA
jgi:predicted small metal-binding protein